MIEISKIDGYQVIMVKISARIRNFAAAIQDYRGIIIGSVQNIW
jgi:hypothetical protein